jgi:hypothetical protein
MMWINNRTLMLALHCLGKIQSPEEIGWEGLGELGFSHPPSREELEVRSEAILRVAIEAWGSRSIDVDPASLWKPSRVWDVRHGKGIGSK